MIIVLCQQFGFSQIKIQNPCAIDYNTIIIQNTTSKGAPTINELANIYYSVTSFVFDDASVADGTWSFGDGTPTKPGKVVQHQYLNQGIYTVTFTTNNGTVVSSNVNIKFAPKAPHFLSKYSVRDTSLCADITLNPYKNQIVPSTYQYEWYPEPVTTKTFDVKTSDLYSVKVTDSATGCSIFASTSVTICGSQPLPSVAQYHFGNGIKRIANHGVAAFATEFPIDETYQSDGILNSLTASSSVSNPNPYHYQRYMFSTDGSTLFGSNNQVIASDISGSGKKAIQTIIVPKVEADTIATTQYYVLTVNEDGVLSYTLVENRGKAEGDAKIVSYTDQNGVFQDIKNKHLLSNMNGKLVASKYYKGATFMGYYIVVAGKDGNYYTYKVTPLGIEGPVKSPGVGIGKNEMGQIKFSADGTKIISAISAPPQNQIQICDFDSTAGRITGCRLLNLGSEPGSLYGIEFSPDGNYIFYTLNGGPGGTSQFRRFDILNNKSFLISKEKAEFGALEAFKVPGNQTEIVMAINGEKYIASLERPSALIDDLYQTNYADTSVAYRQERLKFTLKGHEFITAKSTLGLNNAVNLPPNNSPSSDALQFEPNCEGKSIGFQASPKCNVPNITYQWDFGDGGSGTGQKPSHTFKKAGLYPIKLFITYCNKVVEIDDLVEVIANPKADSLKKEYENCFKTNPNFGVTGKLTNINDLDVKFASQIEHEWTGINIVGRTDLEKVVVNNAADLNLKITYFHITSKTSYVTCESNFKTKVVPFCPPVFAVPTIYTPNNDGKNDILEVIKIEIDTKNFEFRIFNRWGELVYFSETVPEPNPWDGKYKGCDLESDSFAWTATYKSVFKPEGITYKAQGAILLVR